MKVLFHPETGLPLGFSGRDRNQGVVWYLIHRRQYARRYVVPLNPQTAPQCNMRQILGALSKDWSALLTQPQRAAWNAYAWKVPSRWRAGQGPVSGQNLFLKLNSVLRLLGRPTRLWPPRRAKFYRSPVAGLRLSRCEDGRVRIELVVAGPLRRDLMVSGAAPCSAGWSRLRHPVYLGLLPARGGRAGDRAERRFDITDWYVGRFGEPEPRQQVFIRVRQHRNGWESAHKDVSDVVPAQRAARPPRVRSSAPSPETLPPAFSPIFAPLRAGVELWRPQASLMGCGWRAGLPSRWAGGVQRAGSQSDPGVVLRRVYRESLLCMAPVHGASMGRQGGMTGLSGVWRVGRAGGACARAGKGRKSHSRDLWRGG